MGIVVGSVFSSSSVVPSQNVRAVAVLLGIALAGVSLPATAQSTDAGGVSPGSGPSVGSVASPPPPPGVTPPTDNLPRTPAEQARHDAGAAYEQGDRAFAAHDYGAAAEFYETADRLVPSAAAGVNAVRAHRGCHTPAHNARAATLSLRLLTRYPGDTRVTAYAYRVTDDLAPTLARLQVRCQGCDLAVDQQSSDPNAYITPGHHVITGAWGTRVLARDVDATAGATVSVILEPPLTEVPSTPPARGYAPDASATNGPSPGLTVQGSN